MQVACHDGRGGVRVPAAHAPRHLGELHVHDAIRQALVSSPACALLTEDNAAFAAKLSSAGTMPCLRCQQCPQLPCPCHWLTKAGRLAWQTDSVHMNTKLSCTSACISVRFPKLLGADLRSQNALAISACLQRPA